MLENIPQQLTNAVLRRTQTVWVSIQVKKRGDICYYRADIRRSTDVRERQETTSLLELLPAGVVLNTKMFKKPHTPSVVRTRRQVLDAKRETPPPAPCPPSRHHRQRQG